jgi:N-acetylneuraminic acid mutarotase
MAKGKKSKTAEKQARTLAKQSKKAAKGEKRSKVKDAGRDDDSDAEDVDIDAVLAAYAQEQAKFLKVTEEPCEPPSPRSSSTLVASPSNRNELFVFGGEYYDGSTARFFNDLFVYLIGRGEWRQVRSPNSPLPRSGHAWCRGGNAGGIYLFGGEFSSPKQGTFHHYNDFWHLDPSSREWSRIESTRQGPPARSGHRMTYFKNYVLLSGGFQDTSQQTKYLQDLWIYDCQKYVWHELKLAAASQKPDPRSSFSFLPHDSGAVVYGGYSRVKATSAAGKPGKASSAQRNILKPLIHQDTWFLRITVPESAAQADTAPVCRWERRKKPANPPNPARAGATMAYHKGRGILFGGVHDIEESEEGIDSEFFDSLFAWNSDRNRFFPLTLRRPKTTSKRQQASSTRVRNRGKADEEELLRNLAALETKGSIMVSEDVEMDIDQPSREDIPAPREELIRFELPHRRFNAQLAVQDDTLFVFGGTFEKGDQEFTFNDMYSIDLVKLDGVREIFSREPENWNALADEEEDSEVDEEGGSSSEEDDDDAMSIDAASTAPTEISVPARDTDLAAEVETETSAEDDPRPFPRPFENLRDFFARTSNDWQALLLVNMQASGLTVGHESSVKELRTQAFAQAEGRWWDCREEIRALEDEQDEAGIGEIISIADRGAESGGGRRR